MRTFRPNCHPATGIMFNSSGRSLAKKKPASAPMKNEPSLWVPWGLAGRDIGQVGCLIVLKSSPP